MEAETTGLDGKVAIVTGVHGYAGQRAKRLLDSMLVSRARRMLLYTDESAAGVGASLGFEDPAISVGSFAGKPARHRRSFAIRAAPVTRRQDANSSQWVMTQTATFTPSA